jgi:hypothetical protein
VEKNGRISSHVEFLNCAAQEYARIVLTRLN